MHGCIIDSCISCVVFKWSFKMQIGWTMVIWTTTGKPNGEKSISSHVWLPLVRKKNTKLPHIIWWDAIEALVCLAILQIKIQGPKGGLKNWRRDHRQPILRNHHCRYTMVQSQTICDDLWWRNKRKTLVTPRNSCFGNNMKWTGGRCRIKWVIRKTSVLLDLGPGNPKQRLEHKEPRNCRLDFIREETTPASASLTAP